MLIHVPCVICLIYRMCALLGAVTITTIMQYKKVRRIKFSTEKAKNSNGKGVGEKQGVHPRVLVLCTCFYAVLIFTRGACRCQVITRDPLLEVQILLYERVIKTSVAYATARPCYVPHPSPFVVHRPASCRCQSLLLSGTKSEPQRLPLRSQERSAPSSVCFLFDWRTSKINEPFTTRVQSDSTHIVRRAVSFLGIHGLLLIYFARGCCPILPQSSYLYQIATPPYNPFNVNKSLKRGRRRRN